jgi:hypothetical protein
MIENPDQLSSWPANKNVCIKETKHISRNSLFSRQNEDISKSSISISSTSGKTAQFEVMPHNDKIKKPINFSNGTRMSSTAAGLLQAPNQLSPWPINDIKETRESNFAFSKDNEDIRKSSISMYSTPGNPLNSELIHHNELIKKPIIFSRGRSSTAAGLRH